MNNSKMDQKIENGVTVVDKELGWGKSLPVPSIQEIIRNNSQSLPQRYIRDNNNNNKSAIDSEFPDIPIIDFSLLKNGDQQQLNKLDFACRNWGFFQLINHGVREEELSNIKAKVAAFFDLPSEEKKKYAMPENDIHGYGQAFVVSEEQKLDWNDMMFLATLPHENRNMKYWPLELPGFGEAVEEYSSKIIAVTDEILGNLSLLMRMEKNGLERVHGVMKQYMRMNYYPPCSRPDLVLGLSPHSDGSSLTILLQDGESSGLQIRHEGKWIPVKPMPNVLVVNLGDLIEVWSNGLYKSIEHRVVTNMNRSRISIATFLFADDDAEISPVEPMLQGRPRLYRKIKQRDYARHRLSKKFDGKANLEFLKFANESFS